VDSHFSGKNLIGFVEDSDMVTLQMEIVSGKAPLTDILMRKRNNGFPKLDVKLKVLDGFSFLFDPFFHARYPWWWIIHQLYLEDSTLR
jgi:hypothetical protein